MTMLSDIELRDALTDRELEVDPLEPGSIWAGNQLQPASIDLRLDRYLQVLRGPGFTDAGEERVLDPAEDSAPLFDPVELPAAGHTFVLPAHGCALASTHERVRLGEQLVGRVEGKSSVGRLFLLVHATAGFIDPGFDGQVTLELVNLSSLPIRLWPGMKIGQLAVQRLGRPAARPYGIGQLGSHYQGQTFPQTSRSFERFTCGLPDEVDA